MTDRHLTDTRFDSLPLVDALKRGVHDAGFTFCTPIQAATLPRALAGCDVAGQAQTGTGKTAAFLLATLNRLATLRATSDRRPTQPRALILAPTRELAIQIHKDAEALNCHTGFRLALVYGGTGYDTQRKTLEDGCDVLIGTPGRLIDYFKQHVFDLKAVQVAVLDEADRMFDLGFIKDVRFVFRRMPPPTERLSMLFSATLSYRVTELAYEHMNNPELVRIEPDKVTADKVTQVVYHTANDEKLPLLVWWLRREGMRRSLVFINTKHIAERIGATLRANGIEAAVLSGDVPQTKRQRLLADFQAGRFPVLVATDVAARGLHIPDVSHVFNYDLPQDSEDYVHRIGRTARAGASGDAVSFACEHYAFSLLDIETYIGRKIEVGKIEPDMLPALNPPAPETEEERAERRRVRGRDRDRGGRDRHARGPRERHPAAAHRHAPAREPTKAEEAPRPAAKPAAAETRPAKPADAQPAKPAGPPRHPWLKRRDQEKPVIG